ncbi:MAG: homoserine kinase, partial [Aggregatilineales bacterium]
MSNTRAEAFAPATVANLGVGFDLMGMAVAGAGDIICAEWHDEPGAIMQDIQGDNGKIPYAADENIASVAANAFLQEFG